MGKLNDLRRLTVEDFKQEERQMVEKIANIENLFKEDVIREFNGNVDWNNLKADLVRMTIRVNASGIPINNTKFSSTVDRPIGFNVISATNKDDLSASGYPTGQPWIIPKTITGKVVEIAKVTGLVANNDYTLYIVVYPRKE